MRALEGLAAYIEHGRTGELPVIPAGAVTLAEVDEAIADERIAAALETVRKLKARADESGLSKAERARRVCALAGVLRDCGALEEAVEWFERARRLDRRAVAVKALAAVRQALRLLDFAAQSNRLFIVDELKARQLYQQLALGLSSASLVEQAVALRKLGVDTGRWARSASVRA